MRKNQFTLIDHKEEGSFSENHKFNKTLINLYKENGFQCYGYFLENNKATYKQLKKNNFFTINPDEKYIDKKNVSPTKLDLFIKIENSLLDYLRKKIKLIYLRFRTIDFLKLMGTCVCFSAFKTLSFVANIFHMPKKYNLSKNYYKILNKISKSKNTPHVFINIYTIKDIEELFLSRLYSGQLFFEGKITLNLCFSSQHLKKQTESFTKLSESLVKTSYFKDLSFISLNKEVSELFEKFFKIKTNFIDYKYFYINTKNKKTAFKDYIEKKSEKNKVFVPYCGPRTNDYKTMHKVLKKIENKKLSNIAIYIEGAPNDLDTKAHFWSAQHNFVECIPYGRHHDCSTVWINTTNTNSLTLENQATALNSDLNVVSLNHQELENPQRSKDSYYSEQNNSAENIIKLLQKKELSNKVNIGNNADFNFNKLELKSYIKKNTSPIAFILKTSSQELVIKDELDNQVKILKDLGYFVCEAVLGTTPKINYRTNAHFRSNIQETKNTFVRFLKHSTNMQKYLKKSRLAQDCIEIGNKSFTRKITKQLKKYSVDLCISNNLIFSKLAEKVSAKNNILVSHEVLAMKYWEQKILNKLPWKENIKKHNKYNTLCKDDIELSQKYDFVICHCEETFRYYKNNLKTKVALIESKEYSQKIKLDNPYQDYYAKWRILSQTLNNNTNEQQIEKSK